MVEKQPPGLVEEWPPSPQGTITHVPHHTLVRIAAEHQVPVESLTTLTVKCSVEPLYSAVLEYAALSDPQDPRTSFPLSVSHVRFPRSNDAFDGETLKSFQAAMMRMDQVKLKGGRGLLDKKLAQPKFRLGLGETVIVWPPPPHLTAEYLCKQNCDAKRRMGELDVLATTTEGSFESKVPEVPEEGRENGDVSGTDDNSTGLQIHIVHYSVGEPQEVNGTLSTLRELLIVGLDGSKQLRNFVTEISQWSVDKDIYDGMDHKFSLYRYQFFCPGRGRWFLEGLKRSRTPASVILPAKQMDYILEDVKQFLKMETRKWYVEHGMPHRRSFLFFGPPGTGKTSTIRVIASQFQLNCCFLSMTNPEFSNQDLAQALTAIPANALLVFEDVDALFNKDRTSAEAPKLSFSSFLNALDGLISADGVITVMTTNNIAKLDSALIRGGRVDRRVHFPSPDEEQIKELFMSFYPEARQEVAQEFVSAVFSRFEDKEARSIATLQQLFIDQRENSAEECARSVASFFERYYPKGDTSLTGANHIYG